MMGPDGRERTLSQEEKDYRRELRAARESGARVPDFFLVGHAKCGTTAMHRMLDAHPRIFTPIFKETQFLSRAPYERTRGPRRRAARRPQTLAAYLELFAAAEPAAVAGEASTEYLRTPGTAARIAALSPGARIVAAFREPAEFLRSLHLQLLEVGVEVEPDLRRALELEDERRQGRSIPPECAWPPALHYSSHVRYAEQLREYHERFGRERVMTIVYDDFRDDNDGVMRAMLRFLGVEDTIEIEPARANPTVLVRSRRAERALHSLSVGGGPVGRALRAGVKRVVSPETARGALRAARRRTAVQEPPPRDERLLAELRARYAGEVIALGDYIGRDLAALWGYERDPAAAG